MVEGVGGERQIMVPRCNYSLQRGKRNMCCIERRGSVWWHNINRIREGAGVGVASWLIDNIRRVMGDGSFTLFRRDPWMEGSLLSDRFSR